MITKDNKAKAIALTQVSKNDVGSPQAQVSILTARIKEVTEHLKSNKHDNMARRGLKQMVGRRKRLLRYLERTNFDAYKATRRTLMPTKQRSKPSVCANKRSPRDRDLPIYWGGFWWWGSSTANYDGRVCSISLLVGVEVESRTRVY